MRKSWLFIIALVTLGFLAGSAGAATVQISGRHGMGEIATTCANVGGTFSSSLGGEYQCSKVRVRSHAKSWVPAMTNDPNARFHRINGEMLDTIDEELEMEIDDDRLAKLLTEIAEHPQPKTMDRRVYFKELLRLQGELVKLQDWVVQQKLKVVILFEGRDAAGKGGVIKRITQRLNPRICPVAALPAPSQRERTQWYFQRYVAHLPAGGEIVR